jgi:UDP-glucose 4-epimerase
VLTVARRFRLGRHGPEQVDFLRYRPVLANRRLKEEFGYRPVKTSAEAFEYFMEHARARGQV